MKIATWNINGIKARIDAATTWLKSAAPDIACLQEIKCADEAFPREAFEDLGYNVAVHGQKGFNGVAVLSKLPLDDVTPGLAGDPEDVQARYQEACISVPSGALRVVNIYLPNGNGAPEKFAYKLAWMTRLKERVKTLLTLEEPFVIAGDFNVIPAPEDVYNPAAWMDDALFRPETRAHFQALRQPGAHRRVPGVPRRAAPLHLLGLPGGRLAEEPRLAHRPSAVVATSGRQAHRMRDRPQPAQLGEAVRSRADCRGAVALGLETEPIVLSAEADGHAHCGGRHHVHRAELRLVRGGERRRGRL